MARGAAVKIILTDSERSELEMRVRRRRIARADAVRAEIVLLAADGMNNCAIANELDVSRLTAGLWRNRFAKRRFDGLDDERCGAPRKIGDEKIAEVVTKTLERRPMQRIGARTRWRERPACRSRRCIASGTLSRLPRIAARLSSFRPILSSLGKWVTLLALPRPAGASFSALRR